MQHLTSMRSLITSVALGLATLLALASCASTQADVAWDPEKEPISEILGHEPTPSDTTPLPSPANSDIGIYCLPGADVVEVFQRNESTPEEIALLHSDAVVSLTAFRIQAGPELQPSVDRLLWAVAETEAVFSLIGFDETRVGELDPATSERFGEAFDRETMTALDAVARAVQFCPAVIEAGGVDDLLLDRFEEPEPVNPPRHPDADGSHEDPAEQVPPTTAPSPPPTTDSAPTPTTPPPSTTADPEPIDDGYEAIVDPAYCIAARESVAPALDTLSGYPTDPDVTASAFGLAWEGYVLMETLSTLESEDDVLWLWTGLTNAVDILGIQYGYDYNALLASGDTIQIDGYHADLSSANLALASALAVC